MNAAEIQARWGIPDWTQPEAYPQHANDAIWWWEFLRRRPDYRQRWEAVIADHPPKYIASAGVWVVRDHTRKHVLSALCDPKSAAMPEESASWLQGLNREYGFIVNPFKGKCPEGTVDYRFSLTQPLGPQIDEARDYLLHSQRKLHGKKNTPRPSRELWPLYLRVLDARECGASWKTIGKTIWGSDTAKDKARRTYESAITVRDNFPI